MSIKYLLVRPGKYNSCLAKGLYNKWQFCSNKNIQYKENDRFRTCMYTNTKILVFKELCNHFYMIDVDFNDHLTQRKQKFSFLYYILRKYIHMHVQVSMWIWKCAIYVYIYVCINMHMYMYILVEGCQKGVQISTPTHVCVC